MSASPSTRIAGRETVPPCPGFVLHTASAARSMHRRNQLRTRKSRENNLVVFGRAEKRLSGANVGEPAFLGRTARRRDQSNIHFSARGGGGFSAPGANAASRSTYLDRSLGGLMMLSRCSNCCRWSN